MILGVESFVAMSPGNLLKICLVGLVDTVELLTRSHPEFGEATYLHWLFDASTCQLAYLSNICQIEKVSGSPLQQLTSCCSTCHFCPCVGPGAE